MSTKKIFAILGLLFLISFIIFCATANGKDSSNFCIICFLISFLSLCVMGILGVIELVKFISKKMHTKNNVVKTHLIRNLDNNNAKPLDALYAQIDTDKEYNRIKRAKYENFRIDKLDLENKKAYILNKDSSKKYTTTLTSCTCKDFKERQKPCKHMIRLAGITKDYPLYQEQEQGVIERLQVLESKYQLIEKLIDVFYRIRDHKNKYYTKASPNLIALKELELISLNELPPAELVNYKYNTNELKGILVNKQEFKKSSSKKQLIELFISDENLLKKLPNNIYHVTLNFNEQEIQYLLECLNYMKNPY